MSDFRLWLIDSKWIPRTKLQKKSDKERYLNIRTNENEKKKSWWNCRFQYTQKSSGIGKRYFSPNLIKEKKFALFKITYKLFTSSISSFRLKKNTFFGNFCIQSPIMATEVSVTPSKSTDPLIFGSGHEAWCSSLYQTSREFRRTTNLSLHTPSSKSS